MIPIKLENYVEKPYLSVVDVENVLGSLVAMFLELEHSDSSERLFRMTVNEDRSVRFEIGNKGGVANERKNASYKRRV